METMSEIEVVVPIIGHECVIFRRIVVHSYVWMHIPTGTEHNRQYS
jgi:hypothetical protein